jgi:hypothetical protein
MLVYAKNPQGLLRIGQYRIYGIDMVQGPTEVPFEVYNANQEILEHATYREGYLRKLFQRHFPEVAFRYDELRYLPDTTLDTLCQCMELRYENDWTSKHKVEVIKQAIRNASPS